MCDRVRDSSVGDNPTEVLGRLHAVLDDVAAMDPVSLSDEQRLVALRSVMSAANQLTAATARISLAVDRSTQWAADGARSSSSWISRRTKSDASSARQDIHIASLLRDDLPAFDRAVTAGEVSWAHVRVVSAFIGSKPERREAVAAAEDILLALAKRVDPSRMWPALRRIAAAVDRDVNNGECPADKRFFALSRTLDGYHLTGWVDLVDGSLLRQTLRAIVDSSHRRGVEGPHARPDEGADDEVASDERTNATRTLDALMFMAEKYASLGELPSSGGFRPHVAVSIRADELGRFADAHLHGTGGRREPISDRTAERIACDSTVSRVLLNSEDVPVAVGRATRAIVPALRLLLRERDNGCRFADCDAPADWCDGHHIEHWAQHGETSPQNCALFCKHHHRCLHEGGFTVGGDPNGALDTRRPDGGLVGTTYPRGYLTGLSP